MNIKKLFPLIALPLLAAFLTLCIFGCGQQPAAKKLVSTVAVDPMLSHMIIFSVGYNNWTMEHLFVYGSPESDVYEGDGTWGTTEVYHSGAAVFSYHLSAAILLNQWPGLITSEAWLKNYNQQNVTELICYGNEITTLEGETNLVSFGEPLGLSFTGLDNVSPPQLLNGTVYFSGFEQHINFHIYFQYVSMAFQNGYPRGQTTFGVSQDGSEIYSGIINFNGTSSAEVVYWVGSTETYSVLL